MNEQPAPSSEAPTKDDLVNILESDSTEEKAALTAEMRKLGINAESLSPEEAVMQYLSSDNIRKADTPAPTSAAQPNHPTPNKQVSFVKKYKREIIASIASAGLVGGGMTIAGDNNNNVPAGSIPNAANSYLDGLTLFGSKETASTAHTEARLKLTKLNTGQYKVDYTGNYDIGETISVDINDNGQLQAIIMDKAALKDANDNIVSEMMLKHVDDAGKIWTIRMGATLTDKFADKGYRTHTLTGYAVPGENIKFKFDSKPKIVTVTGSQHPLDPQ